ncbi:MAG: response regulator, partial [Chloroflexi bacterium]|nr:response regulator [Chloroflexota bacterium]
MISDSVPYLMPALPLLTAAIILGVMTVAVWKRHPSSGAIPFTLLLLAITHWSLSYTLELAIPDLAGKIFWAKVQYFGIVMVPVAWLALSLQYNSGVRWATRRNIILLCIVPVITLLMVWTNESHRLFWTNVQLADSGGYSSVQTEYGVLFWVHVAYSYTLMALGTLAFVREAFGASKQYRRRILVMLIGSSVPWIGNVLFVFGYTPVRDLEITPFAFVVTGVSLAWGLFRFRLFEVVPIAREAVLESMIEGVVVLDERGRVADLNNSAQRIISQSASHALGRAVDDVMPSVLGLNPDMLRDSDYRKEVVIEHDGMAHDYDVRVSHLIDMRGDLTGYLIMFRDVTEQKQADAELRLAKEAAESADRAKSEFLTNVSHEIRTPLNGIVGLTDLVLNTDLEPRQRRFLQLVDESSKSLSRIIDDILDYSNIESGEFVLQEVPFSLRELVSLSTEYFADRVQGKGLKFTSSFDSDVPDSLVGDPNRLRQALVNLISNAVKFTERGEVALRVAVEQNERDSVVLLFTLSDTGIGISPEARQKVFDAFSQADNSSTRAFGGTGLSLALTSRIVNLLGGRIWFESEEGVGSNFYFNVVFKVAAEPNMPEPQSDSSGPRRFVGTSPTPLRILLAEDNKVNQLVTVEILGMRGHDVVVAENGARAVAEFRQGKFDVILMDVQMPEMNGFDATAAIRESEKGSDSHTPILALTANALTSDPRRFIEAGMDGCITKPIRSQELLAAVEGSVGAKLEPYSPVGTQPPPSELIEEIMDIEKALTFTSTMDILRQMVTVYMDNSDEMLQNLLDARASGDSETLADAAHRFIGPLGFFAADPAVHAAKFLELVARGEVDGDVSRAYDNLEFQIGRLLPVL